MGDNQQDGTVGKALDVLEMVAELAPIRFSDLLARGGYPKATLYRLLQTLTHQGMLAYDDDRGIYSLGLRLVRLAHGAWSQSALAPLASRALDALAAMTDETVHLAQMDQGQVLYVDKRNAMRPIEMFSQAGKIGPAYCTGVGKAMLAFMPDAALAEALTRQSFHCFTPQTLSNSALLTELKAIRLCGYACDREEHEAGIICVATPILARSGRMIGAVSVTSTTARSSLQALEAHADLLKQAASTIAAETENWRFPEQT